MKCPVTPIARKRSTSSSADTAPSSSTVNRRQVEAGSYVAIRPGQSHSLRNTAKEDLVMLFCYAPKGIVDHWQQELESAEGER